MKTIINRRTYDTATAERLSVFRSDGGGFSDFRYYEESLYRKPAGDYFLYGEGSPLSKYGEDRGDGRRGSGARIVPMTEAEAHTWAYTHLSADEADAIFGTGSSTDAASVSERISCLRASLGLSRADFAALLGCPYRTLVSWETGDRAPAPWLLDVIEFAVTHGYTRA